MKVIHENDIGRWAVFIIKGDRHKFKEIEKWLKEDNIRYVGQSYINQHTFFIRDRSCALAFKLKWM